MININFDMMIAALVMLILNCRGYYKYVMGKQLSEREAARREFMLFPNLYKWVCICSSLLIIVAFTYYCIEGLTENSFRFMIVAGLSSVVTQILQIAQKKVSKDYKNSLVMIVFLSLIVLLFIYMSLY
ncbi:hypothetical protein [uncultured Veillonella sp.]|uniref:hypothetical protein n=1 Tax=uncultured Veillonella sp. TaxID=159268 RepID=UPI0028043635|nr:hypothetical protein [uncultured Veillonella sp.]